MRQSFRSGFPVFLLGAVFLVCACGGKSAYPQAAFYENSAAMEYDAAAISPHDPYPAAAPQAAAETSGAAFSRPLSPPGEENAGQSRKLTKQAELHIRAEDLAAAEKPLAGIMEKYSAWPASTMVYENRLSYSIRVPSTSYDAMLAELAVLGKVLGRTETAEDVTLQYYDLESRLATKRELLKTYRDYLGKAGNIEEILSVESRIADLQQEIDRTGTQFRNLASLVDYSVINLEISGPVSAYSYSEPTLAEKLKELFGSFKNTASSALVVITGIVIYGVPAFLVVILLFWILFGRIGLLKKLLFLAAGKDGRPKTVKPKKGKAPYTPPAETSGEQK